MGKRPDPNPNLWGESETERERAGSFSRFCPSFLLFFFFDIPPPSALEKTKAKRRVGISLFSALNQGKENKRSWFVCLFFLTVVLYFKWPSIFSLSLGGDNRGGRRALTRVRTPSWNPKKKPQGVLKKKRARRRGRSMLGAKKKKREKGHVEALSPFFLVFAHHCFQFLLLLREDPKDHSSFFAFLVVSSEEF